MMVIANLGLLSLLALQLVSIDSKRSVRPMSKQQAKFLSAPFNVCHKRRHLSPVESVQAHVLATKIFRECGKDLVIRYAQRYRVPGEALYLLGKMACML